MEYEELFNEVDECLQNQFNSIDLLGIAMRKQLQKEMNKIFVGMTDDMKLAMAHTMKEICEDIIFECEVNQKAKRGKNESI